MFCKASPWPATLAAGLEHEDLRPAARQALRGFLDKIVIPPGDELLQVIGSVGMMLAAAQGRSQSRSISVMLVAGARNQHYLQLWRPPA
jgi:hypothetical protein